MNSQQPRGFKIDLQIRRHRQQNMDSPSHNKVKLQAATTKSTNHSKKLNVTIHNKQQQKGTLSMAPEAQAKKIVISEFKVNDSIVTNTNPIPKSLNLSSAGSIRRQASTSQGKINAQKPSCQQWWVQGQMMQVLQKRNVISQILKKQAQIVFYQNLLQEKGQECQKQAQMKQRQYEDYIQTLIRMYQAEVEKNKQLATDIENKEFEKKRQIINYQGRMGLNFSPKQLSTLSGMSVGSMLLDSIQRCDPSELKKRRSEIFSFGSSNKLDRSRSVVKQTRLGYFLNPGKVQAEGRRIFFE